MSTTRNQSSSIPVSKSTVVDHHNAEDEEASLDIRACSLCHCSLDYSDRAAFFPKDREEDYSDAEEGNNDENDQHTASVSQDSYFYRRTDPYLPVELYDIQNALVYCDHCDRMYHQKCHFVSILVLPRGSWICLFCQSLEKAQNLNTSKKKGPNRKQIAKEQPSEQNRSRKRKKDSVSVDPLVDFFTHCTLQDRLFQSPPDPVVHEDETRWETASRFLKASIVQHEFGRRIQTACAIQWSNYRLAVTALETLSSTAKNRMHFAETYTRSGRVSQELVDGLVKYASAKYKLRELVVQLDRIRCATDDSWDRLVQWVKDQYPNYNARRNSKSDTAKDDFVSRVLFPFGMKNPRRREPRTREMTLALQEQQLIKTVPAEIHLSHKVAARSNRATKTTRSSNGNKSNPKTNKPDVKNNKSKSLHTDQDGGISLDELACCVCFTDEATDENDLIMCDGRGCYRAYHMKCVKPEVTPEDIEDENNNWFCPLCSAYAQLLLTIQTEFMGDDWEQRRYALAIEGKPTDGSVKSWESVSEVFPEAPSQYAAAVQLREGQRNAATDELLATIVGLEELMPNDDDDDEEEDSHFDLDSYREERRRYREEHAADNQYSGDDDDVNSSQATLVEMSSVELEIKADELAELSDESVRDEQDSNIDDSKGRVRRSRRLNQCRASKTTENGTTSDPGRLDAANILVGKRDRKPVDYIRLNDAIFGELSDGERAILDDTDEFKGRKPRKSTSTSSNDSDSEDNDSLDDDGSDSKPPNTGKGGQREKRTSTMKTRGLKSKEGSNSEGNDSHDDDGSDSRPPNAGKGGQREKRTNSMKTRGLKSKKGKYSRTRKNGKVNGVHEIRTPHKKSKRLRVRSPRT